MSTPYVVGAAMIRMGRYPDSSYAALAAPAASAAVKDAGIELSQIDSVYAGHTFGGPLVAQRVMKVMGLGHVPMLNIDNACSSGASALRAAVEAIRAGSVEVALVIGVDKLSVFGGGTLPLPEPDVEVRQGLTMPAVYAMRARRFLHEREAGIEDLAAVSVKNRGYGALNPYAQFRKAVTLEEVLASRPIADPLTLLQCCPTGDGAAAVVVVSERVRKTLDATAMRVRASELHSGQFVAGTRDMLKPQISVDCALEAFESSGIDPQDLDMVELHDAFSIAELVYYEALGLCGPGESVSFLHRSEPGKVVVNPSGGLLSRGHPVGASGVAQVVEAYWQLCRPERTGARQVPDARLALTHVTGGGIAGLDHGACAIHIFEAA